MKPAASILSLCLLASLNASAEIKWLEDVYNFGAIKEDDGPKEGKARFVNTDKEPTFISRVRPSCGCTGASYPMDLIQPGDTAAITFTYNPAGRPGKFDKTIKVYEGKYNHVSVIRIVGTVVGSDATVAGNFPIEIGPLRMETLTLAAGELKKGAVRHVFVNAYNAGTDTIRPTWKNDAEALSISVAPQAIPPGEMATFSFYLETKKEDLGGYVEYPIQLISDSSNPDAEKKDATFSATIVPDTRYMTVEEIDNGPRAFLLPEFVDFGNVEDGKLLDFKIEILNDGRKEMTVDRVYSRNPLVSITSSPKKIKPGKKAAIKGKLNPAGIEIGGFRIPVEVISDDSLHPVRTANLVGIKD